MPEMQKRLGYRLALTQTELPAMVRAGGSFTLTVDLENQGFAAPFNARPVFVVLRGAGVNLHVQLQTPEPRGSCVAARDRSYKRVRAINPHGLPINSRDECGRPSRRAGRAIKVRLPRFP